MIRGAQIRTTAGMGSKCCSSYVCAVLLLFLLNIVELSIGAGISVYALWLGPIERAPVFVWAPMLSVGCMFIVTAALTWCVLQVSWCTPLLTVCAIFDVLGSVATSGLAIALLVHHETLADWLERLQDGELGSDAGDNGDDLPDIPKIILAHIGNEAWRDVMAVILFCAAAIQMLRAFVSCYLHGQLNEQYYRSRLQAGKLGGSCCPCGGSDADLDEVFRSRKYSHGEAALGYDDQLSYSEYSEPSYKDTHSWAQSGSSLPPPISQAAYSPLVDTPADADADDYRSWTQRYMGSKAVPQGKARQGMPKVEPRRDTIPNPRGRGSMRGVKESPYARDGSLPDDAWMLGGTYKLEEPQEKDDSGCAVQ